MANLATDDLITSLSLIDQNSTIENHLVNSLTLELNKILTQETSDESRRVNLESILHSLLRLSVVLSMKNKIYSNGSILEPVKRVISGQLGQWCSRECRAFALKLLIQLSFDENISDDLVDNGDLIKILERLANQATPKRSKFD